MIDERVEDALNDQINAEFYSAYLYLSMAADFADQNLDGFSHWMRLQAQEEVEHAMRIFDFVLERGGTVELGELEKPKTEWESPKEAFKDALEHEEYITGRINDLVDLAKEKNDRATENMLQWFVDEQVEEEDSVDEILQKLKMAGDSSSSLLMLDSNLGQRTPGEENEEGSSEEQ